MRRFLPLALLAGLPSCVFVTTDVSVHRADGSSDSYIVKRRGDRLSVVEARWGGDSRIESARAVVFVDLDGDRRVDQREVLHDLVMQMDEPARSVRWRNIDLDDSKHDGPFLVEFHLRGSNHAAVRRVVGVNPDALVSEFDSWD